MTTITEPSIAPQEPKEPTTLLDRIACIETATRLSIVLALTALIGRGFTLLIDGATPTKYLVILLGIAFAAFVAATASRKKARTGSKWNARLSAMSQRIGIIQMLFSIAALAFAVL